MVMLNNPKVFSTRTVFLSLLTASVLGLGVYGGIAVSAQDPGKETTSATERRAPLFNAEHFTLANGLEVVVIPNHRAPVVTHMVWYKTGAAHEENGKTGLAHFLEHLMFKGSPNVPPGTLSKRVRALGGNDNAFTTQDYTAYYQNIAVQHLETVMAMEADRMQAITLPQAEFDSEKLVVLEERRQNTENDPQQHFFEQLRYSLFPGHPYSAPVIGWKNDIEALTRDDALEWHKRWYAPNNAILVVAGDITAAQLKPLAEKIYGPVATRTVPALTMPQVSAFPGQATLTLSTDRIRQAQYIRLTRVPGVRQDKANALALEVLTEILSGNPSSRLYKSLVVDQKIAINVGLYANTDVLGIGTLSLSATPADTTDFESLEKALDAELLKLAKDGVTATELTEAKTRLKDSAAFATDSLSGPANIFGRALSIGLGIDDVEYWTSDIETVTADAIQAAARHYLMDENGVKPESVIGHIVPPQTAGAAE